MRTRCPQCNTVFRITPEQLRLRAGKVRCGHCQAVFNALETLVEEPPSAAFASPPPAPQPSAPFEEASRPDAEPAPPVHALDEPAEDLLPAATAASGEPEDFLPEETASVEPPNVEEGVEEETLPEQTREEAAEGEIAAPAEVRADEPASDESPEETTEAARAAGLVAARDLTEAPGYNRWASSPLSGMETEPKAGLTWPFTLAAVLLALALLAQFAYHFRTALVLRAPAAEKIFSSLGIVVPHPRQADLVSIEASDLQADAARGLLVLQATLKNRAPYAQDWPALELTLTDAQDAVVARRVLQAADYLPPQSEAATFAANGEISIRLWIEAKGVAAAGYRLYVFYP